MFERDRRSYMGYTIGRSLFSSRWVVRLGSTYIGSAPFAFDAVELVDGIIDAHIRERVLQGDMSALNGPDRPGRDEAIMGKNPSLTMIGENIGRAARALERDLPGLKGKEAAGEG
jgi:hypothetical protein